MTEMEWLNDPDIYLAFNDIEVGTERRVRLFALACLARVDHLLTDVRFRTVLSGLEQRAEGKCSNKRLRALYRLAEEATEQLGAPPLGADGLNGFRFANYWSHCAAWALVQAAAFDCVPTSRPSYSAPLCGSSYHVQHAHGSIAWGRTNNTTAAYDAIDAEKRVHVGLLRDILGNPFRSVLFSPQWCTDTTVTLARQMYDSRDFGAMPILADALQDAGCDSKDILDHCRGHATHVRGCWVVDFVLGNE